MSFKRDLKKIKKTSTPIEAPIREHQEELEQQEDPEQVMSHQQHQCMSAVPSASSSGPPIFPRTFSTSALRIKGKYSFWERLHFSPVEGEDRPGSPGGRYSRGGGSGSYSPSVGSPSSLISGYVTFHERL